MLCSRAVRRALLLLVSLLAWPGRAPTAAAPDADPDGAEGDDVPAPDRLRRPADARRRRTRACACMRGSTLVATDARARATAASASRSSSPSPGPFHVAWLTARSNEVTVRIRPTLDAQLVGSQRRRRAAPARRDARAGAGRPRARPGDPRRRGRLRPQLRRRRKVALGTREIGTRPRPADDGAARPATTRVSRELTRDAPSAEPLLGTTSPAVTELAQPARRAPLRRPLVLARRSATTSVESV